MAQKSPAKKPRRKRKPDMDSLPVAVVSADASGKITYANLFAQKYLGFDPVGRESSDIYQGSDKEQCPSPAEVRQALKSRADGTLQFLTICPATTHRKHHPVLSSFYRDEKTGLTTGTFFPGLAEIYRGMDSVLHATAQGRPLDSILQIVTDTVRTLAGAQRAYIYLLDEELGQFLCKALSGGPAPSQKTLDATEGISALVVNTRTLYRTGDIHSDNPEEFVPVFPDTVSTVVAPLISDFENVDCYGTLSIDGNKVDQFDIATDQILVLFARYAAAAIAQRQRLSDVNEGFHILMQEVRRAQEVVAIHDILHNAKNLLVSVIDDVEDIQAEKSLSRKAEVDLRNRYDRLQHNKDLMLLLLAMADFRSTKPDRAERGVTNLVAEAKRVARTIQADDAHVNIEVQDNRLEYEIYARRNGILFLIYNLVSNAIAAIRNSASSGTVTIEMSDTPGNPRTRRLIVEDDGPGLPRDKLELVRTGVSFSKRSEGSGIGLLSVRTTVSDLGGHLEVASRFGKSTKFTIDLPGPHRERE